MISENPEAPSRPWPSPTAERFDVVVVGGGPGGSTAGAFLSRAGLRVLLLEGKRFPRWHIGESLLAASMPVFEELGVLPELERFRRKLGSLWVWGGSPSLIRLEMPPPGYAFQVQREQFDQILLDNARATGTEVRTEHWARDPVFAKDGRITGLQVQGESGIYRVQAEYLVDASGLFQYLPRRLNLPMHQFGPPRIAVTAYWHLAKRPDFPYTSDVISEACDDGWIWFIPFAGDVTSVGFVGDAQDLTEGPEATLARQVGSSQLIRRLLEGAAMTRRPRLLRYTNHTVATPLWERGYVLVGDTAAFVDPLFSTGINATVYSASLAAAGVAAVMNGDLPDAEAAAWYDRRVRGHYRRTTEMTRLLYATHPGTSRFWRSRSLSTITDPDAGRLLGSIGADGLDLFTRGLADGAIELPVAVRRLLSEFRGAPRPTSPPAGALVSLSPEVGLVPDWNRRGGRLVPVVRLAHARRRTHELDLVAGSAAHRLVSIIDGGQDAVTLAEAAAARGHERHRLRLLIGALASAGIVEYRDASASCQLTPGDDHA